MMLLWDLVVLRRCCESHSFMEAAVGLGRCCESRLLEHSAVRVSRLMSLFWVHMLQGDVV